MMIYIYTYIHMLCFKIIIITSPKKTETSYLHPTIHYCWNEK